VGHLSVVHAAAPASVGPRPTSAPTARGGARGLVHLADPELTYRTLEALDHGRATIA
jgi:hypothetical protein